MATFGGSNIVKNGLVLHLDAANQKSYRSGGTTWFDLSGQNNHGTLTNGPTFNSSNGGSIVFDGVNDYSNHGSTPALTGIINLSVNAWVYVVNTGSCYYVSRYYNTTVNNGWILSSGGTSANQIAFGFDGRESSAGYFFIASNRTYSVNNWYYVSATKSSNNWSLYINGLFSTSSLNGLGTVPYSVNNLQVGALIATFQEYNKNRVSQVQIYNRALSASEVLQNYNATKGRFNL